MSGTLTVLLFVSNKWNFDSLRATIIVQVCGRSFERPVRASVSFRGGYGGSASLKLCIL